MSLRERLTEVTKELRVFERDLEGGRREVARLRAEAAKARERSGADEHRALLERALAAVQELKVLEDKRDFAKAELERLEHDMQHERVEELRGKVENESGHPEEVASTSARVTAMASALDELLDGVEEE